MGLFDAIRNLFGEQSEKEAEEVIQLANDPEGDEWNDYFPTTPQPDGDTPDEIEAVRPEDKDGGGLFGR